MHDDPSALLLRDGMNFTIPPGAAGTKFAGDLSVYVPSPRAGRTSAHRERFCIVALLKRLLITDPYVFPLAIARQEAPDFLLTDQNGRIIAVEHTDAGEPDYQRFLTNTEGAGAPALVPSPNGNGWVGDAPEQAFRTEIRRSLNRKANARFWRNAPPTSECWLLVYDQTNASGSGEIEGVAAILRDCALEQKKDDGRYNRIYFVRSQEDVIVWDRTEGNS